jgi:hypothetical protein
MNKHYFFDLKICRIDCIYGDLILSVWNSGVVSDARTCHTEPFRDPIGTAAHHNNSYTLQ